MTSQHRYLILRRDTVARVLFMAIVTGVTLGLAVHLDEAVAQAANNSHLKITSTVACGGGGSPTCEVIDNSIVVHIAIERQCSAGSDEIDSGILTLTPGNPGAYNWNCNNCLNGFFSSVVACPTQSGCSGTSTLDWLVGVQTQNGGGGHMGNCNVAGTPDDVGYDIDSADLGNGKRWIRTVSCTQTVTPVTQTYSVGDPSASWDNSTLCSNNGVSINLSYQ